MNDTGALVYVVDDDASAREGVARLIRSAGLMTKTFATGEEFLATPRPNMPSCLVLDVNLPGLNGLELQQELAKSPPQVPIIFLTGHGDIPMTVRAVKAGAANFLTKPVDDEALLNAIRHCVDSYLGDEVRSDRSVGDMIGESPALQAILRDIQVVAPTDAAVRVEERTRIARELHDTLLQSFQASLIQMQAARNVFARRPEKAVQSLDDAITMAAGAVAEGRNAIQDLRVHPASGGDLAQLLTAVGQELAHSEEAPENPPVFRVTVEGERQDLEPLLQDEVYRIARELLRNAFRHAQAGRIEAEIRYESRQLRVHVRDDGKGIDPEVLKAGGRAGHWGLPGMRERADRFGGKLEFWSEAGAGTEAVLTVPAAVAYGSSNGGPFSFLRRKQGGFMNTETKTIRILTADDHALLRQGIAALVDHRAGHGTGGAGLDGTRGDRAVPAAPAGHHPHGSADARYQRYRGDHRHPRRIPRCPDRRSDDVLRRRPGGARAQSGRSRLPAEGKRTYGSAGDHPRRACGTQADSARGRGRAGHAYGSVATLRVCRNWVKRGIRVAILRSHLEQLFNELNLALHVVLPQPANLPLPDHVHRLISLNRSPGRMEFSKALLGVDSAFDRAVILLDDVVQVLNGSMPATAAKRPFLLNCASRKLRSG